MKRKSGHTFEFRLRTDFAYHSLQQTETRTMTTDFSDEENTNEVYQPPPLGRYLDSEEEV